MMKIRATMMFVTAQAALSKWHTGRRSVNIAVEDRAIQCNRNMVAKQFVQHSTSMRVWDEVKREDGFGIISPTSSQD